MITQTRLPSKCACVQPFPPRLTGHSGAVARGQAGPGHTSENHGAPSCSPWYSRVRSWFWSPHRRGGRRTNCEIARGGRRAADGGRSFASTRRGGVAARRRALRWGVPGCAGIRARPTKCGERKHSRGPHWWIGAPMSAGGWRLACRRATCRVAGRRDAGARLGSAAGVWGGSRLAAGWAARGWFPAGWAWVVAKIASVGTRRTGG